MTKEEVAKALVDAGIENASFEAGLLCEAFSGEALSVAVARRITRYPLQYILGEWGFYRETYEVNEDCLVPRSDTEILVDEAIKMLPHGARFLDLCTGSGCIAVSTLANRPDTTAVAVDLYPRTLALAERNAHKNGVAERARFCLADVQKPPYGADFKEGGFDAILSNPPYILDSVMGELQQEVTFEPSVALAGGVDGLDFYRAILLYWVKLLKPNGTVLFEIGYDQKAGIVRLAKEHGFSATVLRDFGGNDRVAVLKKV